MPGKIIKDADAQKIKKVFGFQPLAWARYGDRLDFLNPRGQKFSYTDAEISEIAAAAAAAEKSAPAAKPKPKKTDKAAAAG